VLGQRRPDWATQQKCSQKPEDVPKTTIDPDSGPRDIDHTERQD
jgi:hypothetical protein